MNNNDIGNFKNYKYPDHIFLPRGMISINEAKLLYYIAKKVINVDGVIVDAGSFVGASTYALAAGLKENPSYDENSNIYSYDIFKANNEYLVQYLQNNFFVKRDKTGRKVSETQKIVKGYDYYDVFTFQVQRYFDLVVPIKGDIKSMKWNGLPIEFLFLDICKTVEINSHIFKEFFPSLIPGKSIIVQQDFHHIYHPYIHITMQSIKDYCSCVVSKINGSRVYILEKEIPPPVIKKIVDYNFTPNDRFELLKDVIHEADEAEKPLLHVTLARDLFINKQNHSLKREIKSIMNLYDDKEGKAYWYTELINGCPGFI